MKRRRFLLLGAGIGCGGYALARRGRSPSV